MGVKKLRFTQILAGNSKWSQHTQKIEQIKITGLNRPTTKHASSANFFVSAPVPQH
jgi:hypothetical protein